MTNNELLELVAKLSAKIESKDEYIDWQYKQIEALRQRIKSLEEERIVAEAMEEE